MAERQEEKGRMNKGQKKKKPKEDKRHFNGTAVKVHYEERHTKETEEKENNSNLVTTYQSVKTTRPDLDSINNSLLFRTYLVNNKKKRRGIKLQRNLQ